MAGLIPLMLASSSRTSPTTPHQPSLRRQSTSGFTGSTTQTQAARPKFPKRLSLPTPVASPVLPYTQADWKKTVSQVKRQYFGKRYRACSAKCLEILDGVKDDSQVDPVYLIYLHFYAATSMEICARPLPSTSALRTSLLQQARTHFDQAASLINSAEESVLKKIRRPGSVSSSRASSCHSPSGSVSSRAWTPDLSLSSPTDSVCSFDNLSPKSPPPTKRVKKVSFSLPKEESFHISAEPFIRPDSPTLGFDDFYFQVGAARQDLPDLPPPPPPKYHEIELPLQTIAECECEDDESESDHATASDTEEDEAAPPPFHIARSVDRCCEHLSGLRSQLARHSTSLEELLSAANKLSLADATRSARARSISNGSSAEEARALDRQARIVRLRSIGWQRKRFDPRRYEELCEAVMAELN
ncbi:hypothetical protein BT67DRAFT_432337 [Trichocladium antarcticum]|uniref:Uncharacterized protein n=1 Tax=Trichocladium antarcticum TaxID=1450529 RepID=A0AAN6UNV6_9PEZI|nr:hypothetical protein BT67DRAFT_432337 [Trichocladium antarcticum]